MEGNQQDMEDNMERNMEESQRKFAERLERVNDAIALREPDMVPMAPWAAGMPYQLYPEIGASHKSEMYDFGKAAEAHIKWHLEFCPDVVSSDVLFFSGKAGESLGPTMMDWPGRPGTPLPDMSIYQMHEIEYMKAEEYDEFLADPTGFYLNKMAPRMYSGLSGLEGFRFNVAPGIYTSPLAQLAKAPVQEALRKLIAYGEEQEKADGAFFGFLGRLGELGFPPFYTAVSGVPFDVLSDYFRGTSGALMDQVERPDKVLAACDIFAKMVIGGLSWMNHAPLPVKRVFFPMHKGMDSFMSNEDYKNLYWAPYQKILRSLVENGVTPLIFTEGPYKTRYKFIREQLEEFPPGSCIVYFEDGDFAEYKRTFKDVACLYGGMPIHLLMNGTKEQVADRVKYLVDSCAAGGGYILGMSHPLENIRRENLETMFETARAYGKGR
ncbi:MAG: hypothetical protein FWG03_06795 [Clostridiales bacterium]|nr:hypothetical protein [Clostridiales bacterium]